MTEDEKATSDAALLDVYHLQALAGRLAHITQTLRGHGLPVEHDGSTEHDADGVVGFVAKRGKALVEWGIAQIHDQEPNTSRYYMYASCIETGGAGQEQIYWSWTSSHGLTWEAPEEARVAIRELQTTALQEAVVHFWRNT